MTRVIVMPIVLVVALVLLHITVRQIVRGK